MSQQETTGSGWAFPPGLNDQGRIALASGEAKIRQSIYVILNTTPGERAARPEFGARLHELALAPTSSETAERAEQFVAEALARWEPRIDVLDVTAMPNPGDLGMLMIEINYRVKGEHDAHSLIYPFYLA
jgi:uncharacterized protein